MIQKQLNQLKNDYQLYLAKVKTEVEEVLEKQSTTTININNENLRKLNVSYGMTNTIKSDQGTNFEKFLKKVMADIALIMK